MSDSKIIHSFEGETSQKQFSIKPFFVLITIAVFVGVFGGFFLSSIQKAVSSPKKNPAKTAGIADKKTFKDKAEGILKEGGIDGEGNFHLERPGGKSQNVYLTSTTVDLYQYTDRKVRVWGETFSGEKAGWLMDVGLVEILQ
ncbi:MAG: hypothetical protein HYW86_01350 [Candidatus Roizmanbacteria bacterium]|nr:MAG: hypothetical protein HYW86_01350 [Candidatus Roizmanbacteria bacterium]